MAAPDAMFNAAKPAMSNLDKYLPLAGGGLGAIGSIASSLIGRSSAKSQMKFQERMSNTAHQREMADLEKAGLNPLLTGKYGGSSTPPGTSFTPENPLKGAMESVTNVAMARANLKSIQQTTMTNSAMEAKLYNESSLANEKWQTEQIARKLLELQVPEANSGAKLYKSLENAKGFEKIVPLLLKIFKR